MQGAAARSPGSLNTKLGGLQVELQLSPSIQSVLIHSACSFHFFTSDMQAVIKPQEGIRTQAGINLPRVTICLSLPAPP